MAEPVMTAGIGRLGAAVMLIPLAPSRHQNPPVIVPVLRHVEVEFTAASGRCRRKRPYFGLDQQVPRVAGKEYVVTRGITEDTWTGFVSRKSLRACLLKDLEYPLVERARNSVLVASKKSPWQWVGQLLLSGDPAHLD
ncbi:hypothetical protein D4764_07G0011860 [Takifugu flavidus]|uniref:Uncharacterized protein n=1 Tax=Takifugu flavidus TaxID=433684 RepID=A0A5C6MYD5_9TELE|nr:hypothetical protein D4764_07G0011860 [Takifugu flavidus]